MGALGPVISAVVVAWITSAPAQAQSVNRTASGHPNTNTHVWTVPASRMRAGREHRVPLSTKTIELLEQVRPTREAAAGFVFPGRNPARRLYGMALLLVLRRMGRADVTPHGFRSTFRDWAAERTNFPREVVEMALAHAIGNKVEEAYRRGDLFGKRSELMDAWAEFCLGATRRPEP